MYSLVGGLFLYNKLDMSYRENIICMWIESREVPNLNAIILAIYPSRPKFKSFFAKIFRIEITMALELISNDIISEMFVLFWHLLFVSHAIFASLPPFHVWFHWKLLFSRFDFSATLQSANFFAYDKPKRNETTVIILFIHSGLTHHNVNRRHYCWNCKSLPCRNHFHCVLLILLQLFCQKNFTFYFKVCLKFFNFDKVNLFHTAFYALSSQQTLIFSTNFGKISAKECNFHIFVMNLL